MAKPQPDPVQPELIPADEEQAEALKADGVVELPKSAFDALMAELQSLKAKVDKLDEVRVQTYPDDDKLFLAKAGGRNWVEVRRVDKGTVEVQQVATAFYGPFETEEAANAYLAAKISRSPENELTWAHTTVVTGAARRGIEEAERAQRESETPGEEFVPRNIFA